MGNTDSQQCEKDKCFLEIENLKDIIIAEFPVYENINTFLIRNIGNIGINDHIKLDLLKTINDDITLLKNKQFPPDMRKQLFDVKWNFLLDNFNSYSHDEIKNRAIKDVTVKPVYTENEIKIAENVGRIKSLTLQMSDCKNDPKLEQEQCEQKLEQQINKLRKEIDKLAQNKKELIQQKQLKFNQPVAKIYPQLPAVLPSAPPQSEVVLQQPIPVSVVQQPPAAAVVQQQQEAVVQPTSNKYELRVRNCRLPNIQRSKYVDYLFNNEELTYQASTRANANIKQLVLFSNIPKLNELTGKSYLKNQDAFNNKDLMKSYIHEFSELLNN